MMKFPIYRKINNMSNHQPAVNMGVFINAGTPMNGWFTISMMGKSYENA